jgi:hypothetical protein
MSLINIRSYFRTHLDAVGFTEWTDGFNVENIPSTILDNSYHIENGVIASTASNHQAHLFRCPVTIRVFYKGFADPASAIDNAYVGAESILAEVLLPSNRLGSSLQDVIPINISVTPLSNTNDNSVILQIEFEVLTFMKF